MKTLEKELVSGLSLYITLHPNCAECVFNESGHFKSRPYITGRWRKAALNEVLKSFTLFPEDQETCYKRKGVFLFIS